MLLWAASSVNVAAQQARKSIECVWRPLPCSSEEGLLAERVGSWRRGRLWHMLEAEDDYLLSGFENHPGRHPWQGEHVGKWLHAATLAYEQSHDPKLLDALQEDSLSTPRGPGAQRLPRHLRRDQLHGHAGKRQLSDIADDIAPGKRTGTRMSGWDTWTLRYNIYGLLTYERFHPDPRVVEACRKMADLLIEVYGEGKADLTKYGTRQGISATTLLESIVMLYERTQEEKYLDFAEHIVAMSEKTPSCV